MSVFILWEDRAIGTIEKFGPHAFLIACVAARRREDRHRLARSEQIDGKPCAGNAKLLGELRRGPLWNSGARVVAVLDTDEIHDRIPGIAARRLVDGTDYERWSASVATEVCNHAPEDGRHRLEVCLLDRNLESLLSLLASGGRDQDRALAKDRLYRDKLLHRAASDEALLAKACAEMPSWERLVSTVTRLLAEASANLAR